MSLSTSSSKSFLKMLLSVAAGLLCIEAGLRWSEESLSLDLKHIRHIPEVVEPLRTLPRETPSVLFLGNSLTRHGIKPEILSPNWKQDHWIGLIYPDATAISDWYFIYRRYLTHAGLKPDLLVLVTAQKHLRKRPFDPLRMGAFWVSGKDRWDVLTRRLGTMEERSVFVLSRLFTAYANRGRIGPRVYTILFPTYQEALRKLNTMGALAGAGKEEKADYTLFQSWLEDLKASGTGLVIVEVPHQEVYPLDHELVALSKTYSFPILNLQSKELYGPSAFFDGYHLGKEGGETFSRELGKVFPPPSQWRTVGRAHKTE